MSKCRTHVRVSSVRHGYCGNIEESLPYHKHKKKTSPKKKIPHLSDQTKLICHSLAYNRRCNIASLQLQSKKNKNKSGGINELLATVRVKKQDPIIDQYNKKQDGDY